MSNQFSLSTLELVRTKVYIPTPPEGYVARPRLVARLDASARMLLTLVAAPAGFGKTTLLAAWCAHAASMRIAWLSLEPSDDDPVRFLMYLCAAFESVDSERVKMVRGVLETVPQLPAERVMTTMLNGLAEANEPITLVLDDVHVLESAEVHALLGSMIEHCPPCLHIILATRADPDLPLGRYRVRGQLNEVRGTDLRFTYEEAAAFLNQAMGLNLQSEEIRALEARTEGWVAGLQLAALSLRTRTDRAEFIEAFSGSHRFVLDYLVEQVLAGQTPERQQFLMETSLLERVNASLANAVREASDGQAQLEWLDAHNLFLIPLDDARQWYRYHHLFAEFLRHRLRQEQPARVVEIYRRAAEWHANRQVITEAIDYALAAGDLDMAAELVETHFDAYWTRGQFSTLARWFAKLPEALLKTRPRTCIARAWFMYLAEPYGRSEMEMLLAAADKGIKRAPASERRALRGMWATVRASDCGRYGETKTTITLAQRALRELPVKNDAWRLNALMALGNAYENEANVTAAAETFTRVIAVCERTHINFTRIVATRHLATLCAAQGRLDDAQMYYERVIADMPRYIPEESASGTPYIGLGEVFYEWNELARAQENLQTGLARAGTRQELGALVEGHMYLLLIARAYGKRAEMMGYAKRIDELLHHPEVNTSGFPYDGFRAWVNWALGEAERERVWAGETARGKSFRGRFAEFQGLVAARILLACGEPKPAARIGGTLYRTALKEGRILNAIENAALWAAALYAAGHVPEAFKALHEALKLAEPRRVMRPLLDVGEPLRAALQAYRKARQTPARERSQSSGRLILFSETLLAAFSKPPAPAPAEGPVEPLSARELEILRLVVRGASNQEIARELVIALSTVKAHTNTIYAKLGVTSRTQAIRRGQELKMV